MKNTKKITINVAGRNYPVIIENDAEEAKIRLVETKIKERIALSTKKYERLDVQDHLALLCLEILSDDAVSTSTSNLISSALDSISTTIQDYLDKTASQE